MLAGPPTGDISACGWHPYRVFLYFSGSAWSWQLLQGSWPNEGSKFVLLSCWNWAKVEGKEKEKLLCVSLHFVCRFQQHGRVGAWWCSLEEAVEGFAESLYVCEFEDGDF